MLQTARNGNIQIEYSQKSQVNPGNSDSECPLANRDGDLNDYFINFPN
jgi:hypothetical protein